MWRHCVFGALAWLACGAPAAAFMDLYRSPETGPLAASAPVKQLTGQHTDQRRAERMSALIPPMGAELAGYPDRASGVAIPALGEIAEKPGRGAPLAGPDEAVCIKAILDAEARYGIPENLLLAIGLQEAGQEHSGELTIWPWSVNSEGASHMFETREEAVSFVRSERQSGRELIDIGCMQVNLRWHPDAFPNLEAGFEPRASADYAAAFLARLKRESGDWMVAAGNYHSRTPRYHEKYVEGIFRNLEVARARADNFVALAERAGQPRAFAKNDIAPVLDMGQSLLDQIERNGGYKRRMRALPASRSIVARDNQQRTVAPSSAPVARLAGAWWSAQGSGSARARSIYTEQSLEPVLPDPARNAPGQGR